MFLARLSDARDLAETKRGVLADKNSRQSAAGPSGEPVAEEGRLAGAQNLGARSHEETRGLDGSPDHYRTAPVVPHFIQTDQQRIARTDTDKDPIPSVLIAVIRG